MHVTLTSLYQVIIDCQGCSISKYCKRPVSINPFSPVDQDKYFLNSVDPYETARNVLTLFQNYNIKPLTAMGVPKCKDGRVYFSYSGLTEFLSSSEPV